MTKAYLSPMTKAYLIIVFNETMTEVLGADIWSVTPWGSSMLPKGKRFLVAYESSDSSFQAASDSILEMLKQHRYNPLIKEWATFYNKSPNLHPDEKIEM